ncbi:hypothetical protein C8J57DRAFT_1285444 [Mycena rebaudengoi]|nr:hypothetical protein C8J57DRAFT_1285444 [Mycena rebaudengoi]
MSIRHSRLSARPLRPLATQNVLAFVEGIQIYSLAALGISRQSRFVRSFMAKKQGIVYPIRQITGLVKNFAACKPVSSAIRDVFSVSSSPASGHERHKPSGCMSMSVRRLRSKLPVLQSRLSFTVYRDPLPNTTETVLPNLISPSAFPTSPFTPANQVLHTPFSPHKCTPVKRHHRNWQLSPFPSSRFSSPRTDENRPPVHTPATSDSPICSLTRRLSLVSPPRSIYVPRRLSYSHACTSPLTPQPSHVQDLASPVMIRSAFKSGWSPSPTSPPRYQLDEFHFSPFAFTAF